MCLGVLADGQALHEPLPEVVPVFQQHCFQGVVQKLQILFQFGEVTSCDGGEPLFFHAEAIFAPVEVVVLAEIFRVCEVGERPLILSGVVFFLQLPLMLFSHRPPEAFILQSLDGGLRDLHIHQPLVLGFPLSVCFHECAEGLFGGGAVLGNIRKGIGSPNDRFLSGVIIRGRGNHVDHLAVVPPVVPGADSSARHQLHLHFSCLQYSGTRAFCKWRRLFFVLFPPQNLRRCSGKTSTEKAHACSRAACRVATDCFTVSNTFNRQILQK